MKTIMYFPFGPDWVLANGMVAGAVLMMCGIVIIRVLNRQ